MKFKDWVAEELFWLEQDKNFKKRTITAWLFWLVIFIFYCCTMLKKGFLYEIKRFIELIFKKRN